MKLDGKKALVTGGGAGIGEGIALCLAGEGADVAIIDINSLTAARVADGVKMMGRKSAAIVANATDSGQANRALQHVLDTFGRIDILVNNVGGESRFYDEKPGEHYSEEKEWDDTIRLNLKATMIMSHAMAPSLAMIWRISGTNCTLVFASSSATPAAERSSFACPSATASASCATRSASEAPGSSRAGSIASRGVS